MSGDLLPQVRSIHAVDHEALRDWYRLVRQGWSLPMDPDLAEDLARMCCGSWMYSWWVSN